VPYLTPDGFGETDDCRSLLIPATTDWLAIVSGALTELVKPYNWQQWGTLTVAECVDRMQEMIDLYYEGCLGDCELPTGTPPFRLGEDGHIEQLTGGEWVAPTGDYTLPPTPEREESTPEERRCLAAANASKVLHDLYENLSDSFAEALDVVEAGTALGVAVGGGIGLVFGLITTALISSFGAAFAAVYAGVEFISADVWTSEFDDLLTCILFDCSIDTDGVVTFDYDCFFQRLWDATNLFDVTFVEQRLFYQLSVIMNILGIEAIDAAGATTSVSSADCDSCMTAWCYRWFGEGFEQGDWVMETYPDTTPTTYDSVNGVVGGFQNTGVSYAHIADITYGPISGNVKFIGVGIDFSRAGGAAANYAVLYINGVDVAHSPNLSGAGLSSIIWEGDRDDITSIEVLGGVESNPGEAGHFWIPNLTMRGDGDNPIDFDNCV